MNDIKKIERSIITTYRKDIWAKFLKACEKYDLISENDKIAVCISGGKDSLLLAKLFQELKLHGKINFDLEFICMDPGFTKENLELLIKNCDELKIPVKIKNSNNFLVAKKLSPNNPCYMCARMRRGFLYDFAKELGCNKIALGHHFNDVIETTLLNVFYAGNFKTMVPKLNAQNFSNMQLIRPLFLVKEVDIERFIIKNGITPMSCGCEVAKLELPSKRREIKQMIENLKKEFNDVDISIFRASENISLEAVLGYQIGDKKVDFNEIYEKNSMLRK